MQEQQTNSKNHNNFNPQVRDIDEAQNILRELRVQLREKTINDPKGSLAQKADELEDMYKDIKLRMKQTASNGEQALSDMKQGFMSAWEDLKRAADKARDRMN